MKTVGEMSKELTTPGGILKNLIEQAGAVIVEDLSRCNDPDMAFLRNNGYRSFAGISLIIVGESIGILGVATDFSNSFSQNNMELLTGIGREIAIAVRNAQLYEEETRVPGIDRQRRRYPDPSCR